MKKTLNYLPSHKIHYIKQVRDIIVSELLNSNKGLVYVILFGSYARGDYVFYKGYDEENNHKYSYISDLDILIVTEKECSEYGRILKRIDDRLPRIRPFDSSHPDPVPPVSMITHTIEHVNYMLTDNEYFFKDIKKEGVMLYDSGQYKLASPKKFTPAERRAKAIEKFDEYFGRAKAFLEGSRGLGAINNADEFQKNIRAFMLHQACENAFVAANLVLKDDRRKQHDLVKLQKEAAIYEPEFLHSFPKETPRDKYIFDLIRRAYIDARYKKNYKVTEEELAEMAVMVENFLGIAERLCSNSLRVLIYITQRS